MQGISPKLLVRQTIRNLRAGINTMIWGGPGIGKSDITTQLGETLSRKVLDLRANLFDPVDIRGVPHIVRDAAQATTEWAVPSIFPTEKDGTGGILFIELGLKLLKEGGILIAVVPGGYLGNNSNAYFREYLIKNHHILSIIKLVLWSKQKNPLFICNF